MYEMACSCSKMSQCLNKKLRVSSKLEISEYASRIVSRPITKSLYEIAEFFSFDLVGPTAAEAFAGTAVLLKEEEEEADEVDDVAPEDFTAVTCLGALPAALEAVVVISDVSSEPLVSDGLGVATAAAVALIACSFSFHSSSVTPVGSKSSAFNEDASALEIIVRSSFTYIL